MGDAGGAFRIDESLAVRVAALSPQSQRWFKTAIQAIRAGEGTPPHEIQTYEEAPSEAPMVEPARPAANLEDVITGKADLREQLEAYPELSSELEGLADVIDLLRETGSRRRRRGEEVLRELLEGEKGDEDAEDASSPEQEDV